jgi:ribosomal protein S18 acetylase RimI-like enzyme
VDLILRAVVPEDSAFLSALYASTRSEELAVVPWDDAHKDTFLRMQFDAQDAWYREHYSDASLDVNEVDGVPAGRLYVHRGDSELRIVDISLLSKYRGRGIGTSLLRDLLAEADAAGKSVTIHVERSNPALCLRAPRFLDC